jgi:hypothetical protein
MRSHLRFSAALLPLVVIACGAPPEAAPHQEVTSATAAADSTGLENLACDIAAGAVGFPEACSVLKGAETILGFIQGLGGSSNSNAQIASQLATLNAEMVQVDKDIKNMWTAFNNAAAQIEQTQQLQIQDQIGQYEANAKDASVRLATWIQTGGTDSQLIASIDAESSQAAMDLTTPSFYLRAASRAGAPNVFDMRQPLLSYLYALSVRLAVISAEDPNFRCGHNPIGATCVMPYNTELQTHLNFLKSLPVTNAGSIITSNKTTPWNGGFTLCSSAQDINSGYASLSDSQGFANNGAGPANCIDSYGSQATATTSLQFLEFWDKWNVEQEMGVHSVQAMAQVIQTNMTADVVRGIRLCLPGRPCPAPYNNIGPLVSNSGLCVTSQNSRGTPGLFTEPCNNGAENQTWQSAGLGATGSLGLSDATQCVEEDFWYDSNGVQPSLFPCSGSSGEQYTVTSSYELQWNRDPSLCLTATGGADYGLELETCRGQANQLWGRTWPIKILPGPIHPPIP